MNDINPSIQIPLEIIFHRVEGDHVTANHWYSYQPIITTDQYCRKVTAWLRRYAGPKNSFLSQYAESTDGVSIIDPATALF